MSYTNAPLSHKLKGTLLAFETKDVTLDGVGLGNQTKEKKVVVLKIARKTSYF